MANDDALSADQQEIADLAEEFGNTKDEISKVEAKKLLINKFRNQRLNALIMKKREDYLLVGPIKDYK
jgi:hypothetical protein